MTATIFVHAMTSTTFDVGPNVVAVVIALIAFATTVFNGVMAVRTNQKVKDVLAEQKPNGGLSQRDAIDRIEVHTSAAAAAAAAPSLPPPQ